MSISILVSLLIVWGIPAGAALYFLSQEIMVFRERKRLRQGAYRPGDDGSAPAGAQGRMRGPKKANFWIFILGVLSFVISQPVLRMPILNWLGNHWEWLMTLPYVNRAEYYGLLAVTAGLFEETARWIGFSLVRHRRGVLEWRDGLAFGLGHGGAEAVWIGAIGFLPQLWNTAAGWSCMVGTGERILAMIIQLGLSFVILQGVRKCQGGYWALAVLLHAAVDFAAVLSQVWLIECIFAAEAAVSGYYVYRLRKSMTLA